MITPWALNKSRLSSSTYKKLYTPIRSCLSGITPLTSRGDKPLTLTLERQLEMLVFYHLRGYESGVALITLERFEIDSDSFFFFDGTVLLGRRDSKTQEPLRLISRSTYGVMVQIFAGLITYLFMAIYCAEEHGERVNMKRVRELRNTIQNELRASQVQATNSSKQNRRKRKQLQART
jgi:hypothetical protein